MACTCFHWTAPVSGEALGITSQGSWAHNAAGRSLFEMAPLGLQAEPSRGDFHPHSEGGTEGGK